jgi:hypothetical protein
MGEEAPHRTAFEFVSEREVEIQRNLTLSDEASQDIYNRFDKDNNSVFSEDEVRDAEIRLSQQMADRLAPPTRLGGATPEDPNLGSIVLPEAEGRIDRADSIDAKALYKHEFNPDLQATHHEFEILAEDGEEGEELRVEAPPAFKIVDSEGLEDQQREVRTLEGERARNSTVALTLERVYRPPIMTIDHPEPNESVEVNETVTFSGSTETDEELKVAGLGVYGADGGKMTLAPGPYWSAAWTPQHENQKLTVTIEVRDSAFQYAREEITLTVVDPSESSEHRQSGNVIPAPSSLLAGLASAAFLQYRRRTT